MTGSSESDAPSTERRQDISRTVVFDHTEAVTANPAVVGSSVRMRYPRDFGRRPDRCTFCCRSFLSRWGSLVAGRRPGLRLSDIGR